MEMCIPGDRLRVLANHGRRQVTGTTVQLLFVVTVVLLLWTSLASSNNDYHYNDVANRNVPIGVMAFSKTKLQRRRTTTIPQRNRSPKCHQSLEWMVQKRFPIVEKIYHYRDYTPTSSLKMAGLFGTYDVGSSSSNGGSTPNTPGSRSSVSSISGSEAGLSFAHNMTETSTVEWIIYVDQSKASLDKGGRATLDALCCLAPPSKVQIVPCLLPTKTSSKKFKAPWIRCISQPQSTQKQRRLVRRLTNFDVEKVDSVDKCYRVLTKHLQVEGVRWQACESLKYKYLGNTLLEQGKVAASIDAYHKALHSCPSRQQKGILLLLRASAYLAQAQGHRQVLQKAVQEWKLPSPEILTATLQDAAALCSYKGTVAVSILFLQQLTKNGTLRKSQWRKIQFRHGLYQNSLLQAAQDSLHATELLPTYSIAFVKAGEILNELWRIKESRQYYEKAQELMRTTATKVSSSPDQPQLSLTQQQSLSLTQYDDDDSVRTIATLDESKSQQNGTANTTSLTTTKKTAETSSSSSGTLLDATIFYNLDLRQEILEQALEKWGPPHAEDMDALRLALDVAGGGASSTSTSR